jgi:quercetin dioxygenase-like cupin family protein
MASTEPSSARSDYYERIAAQHLRPLWEVLHSLVPEQPKPRCVPALWRYADLREPLMEAGRIISAEEAVRRVLILENPALPGASSITGTLYAGLQLLNPGENAPSHRHTQSALRFVLEGQGAYTSVDGQRHYMSPGDLVLTPAWTWHDHANEGSEPVIWLDGLDIPLVRMLDAGFCESPVEPAMSAAGYRGDGADACSTRPSAAVRESRERRPCVADDRELPATAARWISWRGRTADRCDCLRLRRGGGADNRGWPIVRLGAARHLRRAELERVPAHGYARIGAVRVLGSRRAGEVGTVAGECRKLKSGGVPCSPVHVTAGPCRSRFRASHGG